MSLFSKLGPQGRALMGPTGSGSSFESYAGRKVEEGPQELDYLINDLRNSSQSMSVNKVLGYMYHYLPFVKVEHNLRLVFASFLNNPTCFTPGGASFESNYQIIEAFKAITDKKLSVSQPTIPVKTWYTVLFQELDHFVAYDIHRNSWKVLPILSGILLSNSLRDDLYSNPNMIEFGWFFGDWDSKAHDLFVKALGNTLAAYNSDDIINLSLLSLAVTYKRDQDITSYTPSVSVSFLITRLIQLIFANTSYSLQVYEKFFAFDINAANLHDTLNSEVMNKPVVKHLNRLSFLLESYYRVLPINKTGFDLIMDGLSKIKLFNASLCTRTQDSVFNHPNSIKDQSVLHQQFWFFMKNIFFSECIIVQGIMTRFLSVNQSKGFSIFSIFKETYNIESEYRFIALKVVESFYHLNHILVNIGQGGFDSFNFVYYLSLELIFGAQPSIVELEKLSMFLLGYPNVNLNADVINFNPINRGRVLFVMGLWENYLQKNSFNNDYIKRNIFPICFDVVNNRGIQAYEIIEAAHSVLLLCFSNKRVNKNLKELMEYIELIVNQFPRILSAQQLSIAVESLGKQILSNPMVYEGSMYANSADEFLEFINFKCLNTKSGIPISIKASDSMFTSAQPIGEIHAESTMKSLETKKQNINIVAENKIKKPKDLVPLGMLPEATVAPTEYNFAKRLVPETSREAMVLSFVNLVPYLPLSVFLSENLDLNRCELAYRWWYETKKAVAKNIGQEVSRL
ncbi:hypothetical protein PSN45_004209 [Yamadazyma tenuis]|uniref:uncharacterized protein n=1 Tax=Candida tenuis TaxID=2315449 RepID=UPI0027A2A882|nr:hypothetical protein PSN45_004209 [Yamadazyma tenuis]